MTYRLHFAAFDSEIEMIEIKHRFTGVALCSFDVETIKEAVEKAVKGNLSLDGANLYGARLDGARLDGASLYGANLDGARLDGARLDGARLDGARLDGASLDGASLDGTNLYGARLYGANLDGARLYGANLVGASLVGASLVGASLDGETLTKAPLTIGGIYYCCLITEGFMRLGCKRFSHAEWSLFTDAEISEMDSKALAFWKAWKAPLLAMCAAHKGAKND